MASGSLTYADLASFPDDGSRREIIDGDLFVTPSPATRHQVVLGRLFVALSTFIDTHGGGRVYIAPLDVLFSDRDVVQPDLVVVSDADAGIVTDHNIQGAPSLLVEVVSDPRHDRVRKRDMYARHGVPMYLIVDPDSDRVEVYRLDGDRYGKPEILEAGDVVEVPFLPGFRAEIASLLTR